MCIQFRYSVVNNTCTFLLGNISGPKISYITKPVELMQLIKHVFFNKQSQKRTLFPYSLQTLPPLNLNSSKILQIRQYLCIPHISQHLHLATSVAMEIKICKFSI